MFGCFPPSLSPDDFRECPFVRPLVLVAGTDLLRPERTFYRRRLPFAELWWILEGSGRFGVDEEFFEVAPGELIYHTVEQPQSVVPHPEGFLRYYWVHFDLLVPHPLPRWRQEGWNGPVTVESPASGWAQARLELPSRLRPHEESDFRLLFARLVEASARGPAGVSLAGALCHQILMAVADACSPAAPAKPAVAQRATIMRVTAYIHRHFARALTLEELGEVACLHPVYLGRLFKQQVGETPVEYLNRTRIQAAQAILRAEPDRSVQSVAEEVGITSLPHFHRLYRRFTGTTPHASRRR